MKTSDLAAMLASAAQPMTWRQALDAGLLVDCTRAASWVGFTVPAAMTVAAWEEIVGSDLHPTKSDRDGMGDRMRRVWATTSNEVAKYRRNGVSLARICFRHPSAGPIGRRRMVELALTCRLHDGRPYLTLSLECEA